MMLLFSVRVQVSCESEKVCACRQRPTEGNLKVEKLKKRGATIGYDDWLNASGTGPGGVFAMCY